MLIEEKGKAGWMEVNQPWKIFRDPATGIRHSLAIFG